MTIGEQLGVSHDELEKLKQIAHNEGGGKFITLLLIYWFNQSTEKSLSAYAAQLAEAWLDPDESAPIREAWPLVGERKIYDGESTYRKWHSEKSCNAEDSADD